MEKATKSDTTELSLLLKLFPFGASMAPISLDFLPISLALPQFPLLRPATDLLAMSVMGTILTNGSFYGI